MCSHGSHVLPNYEITIVIIINTWQSTSSQLEIFSSIKPQKPFRIRPSVKVAILSHLSHEPKLHRPHVKYLIILGAFFVSKFISWLFPLFLLFRIFKKKKISTVDNFPPMFLSTEIAAESFLFPTDLPLSLSSFSLCSRRKSSTLIAESWWRRCPCSPTPIPTLSPPCSPS